MRITLKLESSYLRNKYFSNSLELVYNKPISVRKVLKDAKISPMEIFFIKVGDIIVKPDYIINEPVEIKLLPVSIAG